MKNDFSAIHLLATLITLTALTTLITSCVSEEPTAPTATESPSLSGSPEPIAEATRNYKLITRTKKVLVLVDPVFMEPDKYWLDWQKLFCLVADRNICDDLKEKNRLMIDRLITDMKAEGLTVFRVNVASTDPIYKNVEALRKFIQVQREFNEIDGAVLLGKFPYAVIEDRMCTVVKADDGTEKCKENADPSYYYTDTVLADGDGNWQKVYSDSKSGNFTSRYLINNLALSNHELGPDDQDVASPEIWISRIDAERAMGGLGYYSDTSARPDLTMVRAKLTKDQIYRLRVQPFEVSESSSPDSAPELELPLIIAIHDAETGEPQKLTPVFGTSVFFKPKKSGYFNLFLNIAGSRGKWLSEVSETPPSVQVETPVDASDFSGAYKSVDSLTLTAKVNKSYLADPIREFELYASYLNRNHLFRSKKWAPQPNMIRMNTDEFFNEKQDGFENLATAGVTQAASVKTFNQGVYLSELFPLGNLNSDGIPTFMKTYKFGSLEMHSNPGGHQFNNLFPDESGWFLNMVNLLQLADSFTPANILFFINHGCSDSNLDFEKGYPDTGSVYLFRFGGLVQFGHSFLGPNGYFKEISETFSKGGDAGSGFLNAVHRETSDIHKMAAKSGDARYIGRKRAYFKVLLGDGTLKSDY